MKKDTRIYSQITVKVGEPNCGKEISLSEKEAWQEFSRNSGVVGWRKRTFVICYVR